MVRAIGRRRFLASTSTLAGLAGARPVPAKAPAAQDEHFSIEDVKLDGDADLSRRAWIIRPKDVAPQGAWRRLVLWHGLGETPSERAGVGAWVERYGLLTSCERLARPPLAPTTKRGDLTDDHARELNRALDDRAFGGRFLFICPYTPNVWKAASPAKAFDRLADWLGSTLLPEVAARAGIAADATRTGIDGCSLGGLVSLELFARRPDLFSSCGGVQAAVSESAAPGLAARLAPLLRRGSGRRIHLETSRQDPFCAANLRLSRELERAGATADLAVLPGPHDQPWLREIGTLEMLLFHDRALGEAS